MGTKKKHHALTSNGGGGSSNESDGWPEVNAENSLNYLSKDNNLSDDDNISQTGDEDGVDEAEEEDGSDTTENDHNATRRDELRRMMSEEQSTVVKSIAEAVKVDAAKGRAVKQQ